MRFILFEKRPAVRSSSIPQPGFEEGPSRPARPSWAPGEIRLLVSGSGENSPGHSVQALASCLAAAQRIEPVALRVALYLARPQHLLPLPPHTTPVHGHLCPSTRGVVCKMSLGVRPHLGGLCPPPQCLRTVT